MPKGRTTTMRQHHHHAKRASTVALVLSMLLMLTLVLLILLALGILSLPVGSDDSPPSIRDSFKFGRRAGVLGGDDVLGKRGEQWTEIISWEPRAFLYHNFLGAYELWDVFEERTR